jgi:hypothetical protein
LFALQRMRTLRPNINAATVNPAQRVRIEAPPGRSRRENRPASCPNGCTQSFRKWRRPRGSSSMRLLTKARFTASGSIPQNVERRHLEATSFAGGAWPTNNRSRFRLVLLGPRRRGCVLWRMVRLAAFSFHRLQLRLRGRGPAHSYDGRGSEFVAGNVEANEYEAILRLTSRHLLMHSVANC